MPVRLTSFLRPCWRAAETCASITRAADPRTSSMWPSTTPLPAAARTHLSASPVWPRAGTYRCSRLRASIAPSQFLLLSRSSSAPTV